MTKNVLETLVGAFVILVAVGFGAYVLQVAGEKTGADAYTVIANFRKAEGLSSGADVKISGVKVGVIDSITLNKNNYRAQVLLRISNDISLPDDTSAKIDSEGLLGGNYLALQPGSSEIMMVEGDEIQYTQGSINLLDLVGKAIHGATQ